MNMKVKPHSRGLRLSQCWTVTYRGWAAFSLSVCHGSRVKEGETDWGGAVIFGPSVQGKPPTPPRSVSPGGQEFKACRRQATARPRRRPRDARRGESQHWTHRMRPLLWRRGQSSGTPSINAGQHIAGQPRRYGLYGSEEKRGGEPRNRLRECQWRIAGESGSAEGVWLTGDEGGVGAPGYDLECKPGLSTHDLQAGMHETLLLSLSLTQHFFLSVLLLCSPHPVYHPSLELCSA